MRNIEQLALSKFKLDKRIQEEVSPGDYNVAFNVMVTGMIRVGEDYTQQIVAKADPWLLLATALSKLNGVTVESIVRDSLADNIDPKEVKKQASDAMARIKGKTETDCKGKVTANLKFV